jgi:S1-C subfamily serine protease
LAFGGLTAEVAAVSLDFDLALLSVDEWSGDAVATFSPSPARLNSDVTVVGYPLAGLLTGLNVTRGAVSSQMGLGSDVSGMQITAPVQPGNSGGPVLAADGEVVGVVVSKLNAQAVADATGDIPQNVNFAIRGEIAKLFLFQHGVEPVLGEGDEPLSPVELAERASGFTGFIECN